MAAEQRSPGFQDGATNRAPENIKKPQRLSAAGRAAERAVMRSGTGAHAALPVAWILSMQAFLRGRDESGGFQLSPFMYPLCWK
ncbi:hypothetical protein C6I21_07790 [Alkalicoccus urumqiensis]|uniref:Uncharacterized protein n=1 Tax=Alkalicoccus urumqiensis TaxID=1548213 RepID=A0A2P6MHR5_ALKUR|nr:hypothetical protein C6I21_07790 [Alkalicoccus urumqiensis]